MKTPKRIIVYILGALVLIRCIAICVLSVHLMQWRQEFLTGPAFGDGGSIMIPITPENALSVGDSVEEGGFLVSLLSTGQYTDTANLEVLTPGWEYWSVTVVIKNISSNEIWINPLGISRIQGTLNQTQGYTYPYKNFGDATTDIQGQTTSKLVPGEEITTTLIYKVPLENKLFWIFGERDNSSAIFQVR